MAAYDLLVVGAGLFGATVAREALDRGRSVLVVDRRPHIAGNCYTATVEGIDVHRYGAHIFRTDDEDTWNFAQRFCTFNNFVNSPVANFHGELYNLPFNMNTFHQLWGVVTPAEAKARIEAQRIPCEEPRNLEEHVLSLVGPDVYERLIPAYTEKQWGVSCRELPASIMRRVPLRFTYDNNYYNARYQGVPEAGFTAMIEGMLAGAEVRVGVDYLRERAELAEIAALTVYTGAIDEYYDFAFGPLGYRSLRFEEELLDCDNYQGVAVMNYTDRETPYTRIIEHKHFTFGTQPVTVISREYPVAWQPGDEAYYPMEDAENRARYERYAERAAQEDAVRFGGRLGEYRYYDMQDTIRSAREKARTWLA